MPSFSHTDFGLRKSPVILVSEGGKAPLLLITDLNQTITVPAFSTEAPSWTGASYIVAQTQIDLGSEWSIETPVTIPNYTFVAAVAWDDPILGWQRRKLWRGVGEILSYPVYSGEILPASGVMFEIWTVRNVLDIELTSAWTFEISTLELPDEFNDTEATGTELATLCLTHADETPDTLEEALSVCNYNE